MEKKINIAEILKDKPKGIRLYSPIFGECAFSFVREETDNICVKQHNGEKAFFNSKGLYNILGECLLFPSKGMRDWAKFSWKKGDVLQNNDHSTQVIFDRFIGNTYKMIRCKYCLKINNGNEKFVMETYVFTKDYFKVNEETRQCYINEIENRLGGKLNLETLEIENAQSEFKDGDIVFVGSYMLGINTSSMIAIFRKEKEIDKYKFSPALCESNEHDTYLREEPVVLSTSEIMIFRSATDSEKKQFFDALAKEGKVWDSEKNQIVDFNPKWITPKPFDRVITRGDNNDIWTANIFSHMNSYGEYVAIGCVGGYHYCLPYNDETAHLIGTTDEWKGGEG